MRFSATIISCNANLFIGRLLQHIYPHFDRIVVVDGPSLPWKPWERGNGTRLTEGKTHSTDGTVEVVKLFQLRKDPDRKVFLIQKNRAWCGKTEKFNDALSLIEPGYIFQIDSDEFFFHKDYVILQKFLRENPTFTDVEFLGRHFWGDPFHHFQMQVGKWGNNPPWRRVFKYDRGNVWRSHEPPRMNKGRPERILSWKQTYDMGIQLYHFGYVHRSQLVQKEQFYAIPGQIINEWDQWQTTKHSKVSGGTLEEYHGPWPINIDFLLEHEHMPSTTR